MAYQNNVMLPGYDPGHNHNRQLRMEPIRNNPGGPVPTPILPYNPGGYRPPSSFPGPIQVPQGPNGGIISGILPAFPGDLSPVFPSGIAVPTQNQILPKRHWYSGSPVVSDPTYYYGRYRVQ